MRKSWEQRPAENWAEAEAQRIATEIKRLRAGRSLQWLSDRTADMGHRVSRAVIFDLENGRRRYVTTTELAMLAAALNTAPVCLLFPNPSDEVGNQVEVIPGSEVTGFKAAQWFSALRSGGLLDVTPKSGDTPGNAGKATAINRAEFEENTRKLQLWRELKTLESRQSAASFTGPDGRLTDAQQEELRRLQVQIVAKRSELGLDPLAGLDPFAVDPFGAGA